MDTALLFPGQGAQHPRMAAARYGTDPVFTGVVDVALALFPNGRQLREQWLAETPGDRFDDVTVAQPLLFSVGYALGRAALERGPRPAALLGHSVGELVAATLAGVFRLEDAVAIMSDRVARLARTPPGGMLMVAAGEATTRAALAGHPEVAIGAVNAPRQTMVSGFAGPLTAAAAALRERKIVAKPVACRQAFHHPALAPLFGDITGWSGYRLSEPRIPLWSGFSARRVGAEALTFEMWAGQPAAPVRFWAALDDLLSTGAYRLVEVGPGQSLATIARRHRAIRDGHSHVN